MNPDLNEIIIPVLLHSHQKPFTLQCDFARTNSQAVAASSTLGLISCFDTTGTLKARWFITLKGLSYLEKHDVVSDLDYLIHAGASAPAV